MAEINFLIPWPKSLEFLQICFKYLVEVYFPKIFVFAWLHAEISEETHTQLDFLYRFKKCSKKHFFEMGFFVIFLYQKAY